MPWLAAMVALVVATPREGGPPTATTKVVGSAAETLMEPGAAGEISGADSVLNAPELPIRLHLEVHAEVRFDSTARAWIYRYRVRTAPGDSALDEFAVAPVPGTARLLAPRGWKVFSSWDERRDAGVWTPWELTAVGDSAGAESLVIVSSAPPANVRFFADQYRSELPEGEGDELVGPTLFNSGVTGIIAGPDTTRAAAGGHRDHAAPALVLHARSVTPIGDARFYFSLRRPAKVSIDVCDSTGGKVRQLMNEPWPEDTRGVLWNGLDDACRPVPPGSYSFRLIVDGQPCGTARVRVPSRSPKAR
jgi:hypothetical protein